MTRPAKICCVLAQLACGLAMAVASPTFASLPDGVWRPLAGPFDPPPEFSERAIRDTRRHTMVLVNTLEPASVWVATLPTTGSPLWQRIATQGTPPSPRFWSSAAYDSSRDRVIVFGGTTSSGTSSNETWTLTLGGSPTWSRIVTPGRIPPGRDSHTAVYDGIHDQMVVFGGYSRQESVFYRDTWFLRLGDNPAWSELPIDAASPPAMDSGTSIFDAAGDRMIMFGGNNGSQALAGTWVLRLDAPVQWDSLHMSATPGPRFQASSAFDPAGRVMFVVGGIDSASEVRSDTWSLELDRSAVWTLAPATGDVTPIWSPALVFSPERDQLLRFGGDARLGGFDALDLRTRTWTPIVEPEPGPSRRVGATAVIDSAVAHFAISGDENCASGELWTFDQDAGTWSQTTGPPQCLSFALDTRRRRLIGIGGGFIRHQLVDQVWQRPLDGGEWTRLQPLGDPPLGRKLAGVVYDPVRDRLLVYGGIHYFSPSSDTGQSLDDLWELSLGDSLRWRPLQDDCPPGGRDSQWMIYDSQRDAVLLGGGQCGFEVDLGDARSPRFDTWRLSLANDTTRWTELSSMAPDYQGVSLDVSNDRLMLFADTSLFALPLEAPGTWQPLRIAGLGPTRRFHCATGYDATRQALDLFGGLAMAAGIAPTHPGEPTADLWAVDVTRTIRARAVQVSPNAHASGHSQAPLDVALCGSANFSTDSVDIATLALGGVSPLRIERRDVDHDGVPDLLGRFPASALAAVPDPVLTAETRHDRVRAPITPAKPGQAVDGANAGDPLALRVVSLRGGLQMSVFLPDVSPVRIEIFDITGRRCDVQRLSFREPGAHVLVVPSPLAAGLYFARLTQGERIALARVVVLRR